VIWQVDARRKEVTSDAYISRHVIPPLQSLDAITQ
jgi:hypothetical protein